MWHLLLPAGAPASEEWVHVPARCQCSLSAECCGEAASNRCAPAEMGVCAASCGCGCMVPAEQRTPRQDPRAINTADWTSVLPKPLPVQMAAEDVQGCGVGLGETASAHLHDGRRRHSVCCIWKE